MSTVLEPLWWILGQDKGNCSSYGCFVAHCIRIRICECSSKYVTVCVISHPKVHLVLLQGVEAAAVVGGVWWLSKVI